MMTGFACIVIMVVAIFWLQGTGKNPVWERYPHLELKNNALVDSLGREINRIFYIQSQEDDGFDIKNKEGGVVNNGGS